MVEISFTGVFDLSTSSSGNGSASALGFTIRSMTRNDQDAVCKVCLRTGDAGKDATDQFKDGCLLGKRWVLPYFEHSPELSFVLVDDKTVCILVVLLDTLL